MPEVFNLVAVSTLAAGTPVTSVPKMFASARNRALADGLTGVMVFDGAGFCLCLEGEREVVLRCQEAARHDGRQTDIEPIFHELRAERRYNRFFTGYAMAEGLPASEELRALDASTALHRFRELAADFDLNF